MKVHGRVLYGLRIDCIKGPRIDTRGRQCSHWTLQKGSPDGQCCKIQDHVFPSGGNLHRYVRGDFQWEEQRRGGHIPGASVAAHPMSIMWGGVNGQFHEGPSHTIAWDRSRDRLVSTASHPYRTSYSGV